MPRIRDGCKARSVANGCSIRKLRNAADARIHGNPPGWTRDVDTFSPCGDSAIRHFCDSPCPAEAYEMNGGMEKTGSFCEFYKEQVNYALRLIADGKANDYL